MSRRSIRTELHSRQQLSGHSAKTPDSRSKEEPSYQPATKVSTRNQGTIFSLPLIMAAANSLLLLSVILLSQFPQSANSISDRELDAAISALRSLGYTLGNPITASDLCFDLLRPNSSYTLLAPCDSALFFPPPPTPFSTLRAPTPGSPLPTVLPHRDIARRRQPPDTDFVTAGSVDVVLPGIFYGQDIAVHGLAGILVLHRHEACGKPVPPPRSTDLRLPPYPSADPPEKPTPAPSPSPTAELFLVVPQTPTRVPSRRSRPTLPAAVSHPIWMESSRRWSLESRLEEYLRRSGLRLPQI